RRRALLALLVVVSLILLTAYFGESPSSPLHTVQRGIVEVLSPVQEGASKALKPVRNIAGWFSDTFSAKAQRDKYRQQVHQLTAVPTYSIVTLITDHEFAVTAIVQDSLGDAGLLVPAVGNPNQLLLQELPRHAPVQPNQQVVTAGFKSGTLDSLYPPNIPIGQV